MRLANKVALISGGTCPRCGTGSRAIGHRRADRRARCVRRAEPGADAQYDRLGSGRQHSEWPQAGPDRLPGLRPALARRHGSAGAPGRGGTSGSSLRPGLSALPRRHERRRIGREVIFMLFALLLLAAQPAAVRPRPGHRRRNRADPTGLETQPTTLTASTRLVRPSHPARRRPPAMCVPEVWRGGCQ
jgi:hypothetical protein